VKRVVMVKKRLASGEPCRKCVQAEEMLRKRDRWRRIDEVVWAEEGNSSSPGMVLAARLGIETAPFFVVSGDARGERVYESALMLLKNELSEPEPTERVSGNDHPSVEDLEGRSPQAIISWGLGRFGSACPVAFSGAEDVVLIDMAQRSGLAFSVITVDTGRLHPETLEYVEKVRTHYRIEIAITAPDSAKVEALARAKGLFSFYRDGHEECCGIRKVEPLRRHLASCRAWITGRRRDQSPATRAAIPVIESDPTFAGAGGPLWKLNPLAAWSSTQVWDYIREFELPYNSLHERGFRSIGCAPCTRAILPGEHERAGRWWWEEATRRECGLHVSRFDDALRRIDAANREDPNLVAENGEMTAKELVYARRMSEWLARIEPSASEELRLAVRAQHLCRWKIARADYPEGRAGYKRWRSDLARLHAELAGDILRAVGYSETSVERVQALIQKQKLKTDRDAQALEDVACLVFLEHYFSEFAQKHADEKLVEILRKTWKKMSARGRQAALDIELGRRERTLVERALAD
jgi:phosphoadenosine phosphosulfate reductase